jgi:hypothetical protein
VTTFTKCTVDSVKYRSTAYPNSPVNLELCLCIEKRVHREYPDNKGIPSLVFRTASDHEVTWLFRNETARDKEFERLLEL